MHRVAAIQCDQNRKAQNFDSSLVTFVAPAPLTQQLSMAFTLLFPVSHLLQVIALDQFRRRLAHRGASWQTR